MTGIIVTPEEAAALRNGQTRISRPFRKQPVSVTIYDPWDFDREVGDIVIDGCNLFKLAESRGRNKRAAGELTPQLIEPPYNVGDEIYVREKCRLLNRNPYSFEVVGACFRHIGGGRVFKSNHLHSDSPDGRKRFTSSACMPKWAARTFLRIKSVKCMRVQDISDKMAEESGCLRISTYRTDIPCLDHYRWLWNKRYAKRGLGWDSNCWIWSWEVERITEPEASST